MTKIRVIKSTDSKGDDDGGGGGGAEADGAPFPLPLVTSNIPCPGSGPIKRDCPDFGDGTHLTQRYRSALLHNNNNTNNTKWTSPPGSGTTGTGVRPVISRTTLGGGSGRITTPDEGYTDSQFQKPPAKIPTKSILLAAFLFVCGSVLLVIGLSSWWIGIGDGAEDQKGNNGTGESQNSDRILPMILIGFLMFIPGFYHVRIAYYAYLGVAGYDFEMIPECDMFG